LTSELVITGFNLDNSNVIEGIAEPNRELVVVINHGHNWEKKFSIPTRSDELGHWLIDFAALDFSLEPYMDATAWAVDNDGDVTESRGFSDWPTGNFPVDAHIIATPVYNHLGIFGYPSDSWVFVEIRDNDLVRKFGPYGFTTDTFGQAAVDLSEFEIDLMPGDFIRVRDEASGGYKELIVSAVTLDMFDVAADIVQGTAPIGTDFTLFVGDHEGYVDEEVVEVPITVGSSRTWSVDLFDDYEFDIQPYMEAYGSVHDGDGDSTHVVLEPQPIIRASLTNGWVHVHHFPPETDVEFSIYQSPSGKLLEGPYLYTTDLDGSISLPSIFDAKNVVPGNWIEVHTADGTISTDLLIADIRLDSFDPETGNMEGRAPANSWLAFNWSGSQWVQADSKGKWSFDTSPYDLENILDHIEQGTFDIDIYDNEWDSTVLEPVIPDDGITYVLPVGGEFTIPQKDKIIIRHGWFGCSRGLVNDYIDAVNNAFYLDGGLLQAALDKDKSYWGTPFEVVDADTSACLWNVERVWAAYWELNLGKLDPGIYELVWHRSLDFEITDGADSDGDGLIDTWQGSRTFPPTILHVVE